ncbi:PRC-barrel domain-containing protein [Desulfosporosinus lacus]|uniref:Uncharacterized protein YrrD, contains PRC-barrel domain n=1 Tax=Desulfosporosinus lacus DSM 15449 TaxID=1121420 RepID=A0A1M5WQG9_9FIRM|nr:PRC-barrel domain-containing protein [Desulfosporosinus lacus]SHH89748.1 Uncharacterized protein YrrD, contains PRC-barrel domain [Desulfosporosinus lacus DSM 15449]
MKKTKVIIGLRVISISDGTQIGVVKDLVLNPQSKSLDFIIIDQPSDYFGAKVVSFTDILGIGEFAITVPHQEVIQDVAQNTEIQNLLKQDIRVIGTKVLTKKGQLIGEVKEIIIDEETGYIASCLFESEGQMQKIDAEKIITLGKELLIIEGESIPQDAVNSKFNDESISQIENPDLLQNIAENEDGIGTEDFIEKVDAVEELEANFNLFEQRQLQYFIGKKVEKDIVLDNGDILRAGEYITPEMVTYIKTRSTLMEVTSHLQKN